ncbi:hypothetical protein EVAR_85341_1 [Eumeta japonica]|uniref:Uncharacterized protein n=1 Tax=Eumeta variegata TaxID=151549 RepID=A0A4C1WRN0_EUMVA|nr:hypothetical protein EVAR_85341_1 [Eumeta japonica]
MKLSVKSSGQVKSAAASVSPRNNKVVKGGVLYCVPIHHRPAPRRPRPPPAPRGTSVVISTYKLISGAGMSLRQRGGVLRIFFEEIEVLQSSPLVYRGHAENSPARKLKMAAPARAGVCRQLEFLALYLARFCHILYRDFAISCANEIEIEIELESKIEIESETGSESEEGLGTEPKTELLFKLRTQMMSEQTNIETVNRIRTRIGIMIGRKIARYKRLWSPFMSIRE